MASSESFGDRVKHVIHEGNVRHVVASKEGKRALDLPLTLVLICGVLAPWLLAILLVIGLLLGYSMHLERHDDGGAEAVGLTSPGAPPDLSPTDSPSPDWTSDEAAPPGESRTL